jgi:hypothetical protein
VRRRYTETTAALALSVLFVVIALFFVHQPQRTIGEASKWTNTLSLAFLSGPNQGSLDDPQQAKHSATTSRSTLRRMRWRGGRARRLLRPPRERRSSCTIGGRVADGPIRWTSFNSDDARAGGRNLRSSGSTSHT